MRSYPSIICMVLNDRCTMLSCSMVNASSQHMKTYHMIVVHSANARFFVWQQSWQPLQMGLYPNNLLDQFHRLHQIIPFFFNASRRPVTSNVCFFIPQILTICIFYFNICVVTKVEIAVRVASLVSEFKIRMKSLMSEL